MERPLRSIPYCCDTIEFPNKLQAEKRGYTYAKVVAACNIFIQLCRILSIPHLKAVGKYLGKKEKISARRVAICGNWVYTMTMDTFLTHVPVAHRGLHDDALPENSIPAFRAAAEAGYAIETDVHFTKDGRLAVFHDDDLVRMTGDTRTVESCTMSELKALKLKNSNETIPTFAEFLDAADGAPLLIEIKNMKVKGKVIAKALSEALAGYRGEYAIQSFNPFYSRAYKKLHPEILCGVLASAKMSSKGDTLGWRIKAHLLSRLRFNFITKPDFVSYNHVGLPVPAVTRFKGIKLAWTIRSPEEETAARKYVDNVIFEGYRANL